MIFFANINLTIVAKITVHFTVPVSHHYLNTIL